MSASPVYSSVAASASASLSSNASSSLFPSASASPALSPPPVCPNTLYSFFREVLELALTGVATISVGVAFWAGLAAALAGLCIICEALCEKASRGSFLVKHCNTCTCPKRRDAASGSAPESQLEEGQGQHQDAPNQDAREDDHTDNPNNVSNNTDERSNVSNSSNTDEEEDEDADETTPSIPMRAISTPRA